MTDAVGVRASAPTGSDRGVWRHVTRWWWLVFLGGVAGAVVGLVAARKVPVVYEARSIVLASESSIPGDEFGSLGTSAFATDTVIQPVISELGLDVSVEALLSSNQLEAVAIRDTIALRIIGRAGDPQLAADLVNAAAESFANTATINGMGSFGHFGSAAVPESPVPAPTTLYVFVGGVAGAATMALLLLVLYFFFPPVLSEPDAREAFAADESFTGRVRVPLRSALRRRGKTTTGVKVRPHGLVAAIQRELAATGSQDSGRISFVALESQRGRRARAAALMNQLVDRHLSGASEPASDDDGGVADKPIKKGPPAVQASNSRLLLSLKRPAVVVAIVAEGASRERLRALSEEVRVAPWVKRRMVVFVRPASWRSLVSEGRRGSIVSQATLQQRPRPPGSSRRQAKNT